MEVDAKTLLLSSATKTALCYWLGSKRGKSIGIANFRATSVKELAQAIVEANMVPHGSERERSELLELASKQFLWDLIPKIKAFEEYGNVGNFGRTRKEKLISVIITAGLDIALYEDGRPAAMPHPSWQFERPDKSLRQTLEIDPNLEQVVFDSVTTRTVVLVTGRASSSNSNKERWSNLLQLTEDTLKKGLIVPGLGAATYKQIFFQSWSLTKPLPTTVSRIPRDASKPRQTFINAINMAGYGGHVVLVLHGIDGLCCLYDSWLNFQKHFATSLNIRITLLIGEYIPQWMSNTSITWSYHDWTDPVQDRYWLACDLEKLLHRGKIGDIRVYKQILDQWESSANWRKSVSEAKKKDGRTKMGRSGGIGLR